MARVLIVGTGPSAAFAVQACKDLGILPEVWGERPPHFTQAGAFFIHWLPESIQGEPIPVLITSKGSAKNYALKQWGSEINTSFPEKTRVENWHSSVCLADVWAGLKIVQRKVQDLDLYEASQRYSWVFHSFPLTFHSVKRKTLGFPALFGTPNRQNGVRVQYNGSLLEDWVRLTDSFGRRTLEFPVGTSEEILSEYEGGFQSKPKRVELRDLPPEMVPVEPSEFLQPNLVPIGRWSCFDRKMLSHSTYGRVRGMLL